MDLEYVIDRVREAFPVVDMYSTPEGISFILPLLQPDETREAFKELATKLLKEGMVPKLYKSGGYLRLDVYRATMPYSKKGRVGKLALFALTLITVLLSGWVISWGTLDLTRELGIPDPFDPLSMTVIHAIALLSPLIVHEFGHMLASRRWGGEWEFPTFIPAPPAPLGFGTFGAIISSKKPVINRDELFDLGISGPLAGFFPGLIVGIMGMQTSIRLPPESVAEISGKTSYMPIPLALLPFGGLTHDVILLSPVGVAGALVLLITFLNLLPVSQLDGGHVIYSLLGEPKYGIISWLAVLSGFLINPFLGVFLLIFNSMMKHPPPLDEYTPVSRERKVLGGAVYVMLLLLTMPIS